MSNYWNKLSPLHGTVTKRQSHATGGRVGLKDGKSVKATEGASINIDVKSEKYLNYLRKNIFGGKYKADKILKDPKYAKKVQKIWDDRKAKKELRSVVDVRAKGGKVKASLGLYALLKNKDKVKSHYKKRASLSPASRFFNKGGPIKAKKGLWTGAKTNIFEAPSGWDAKKISKKTGEKLFKVFKHRERGGYKQATDYKKYLKGLKKITGKTHSLQDGTKLRSLPANLSAATKVAIAQSPFLKRRFKLASLKTAMTPASNLKTAMTPVSKSFYFKDMAKPSKLSKVLKKVGRRTALGKAAAVASGVALAYEAGKRNLFKLKDVKRDKKKVDKKSIGGETVVMKSGGGYIDDLL